MDYIRYKELEKMTRIKAGVSAEVEVRLVKGKCLEELLKQSENMPVPLEEQVIILHAREKGFLDNISPAEVRGKLDELVEQVRQNCPDLINALVEKNVMTNEIREGLDEQIARFSDSLV